MQVENGQVICTFEHMARMQSGMLLSNFSFKQLISYNRMYQPDGFSVLYYMYTQLTKTTRVEL